MIRKLSAHLSSQIEISQVRKADPVPAVRNELVRDYFPELCV
jgi:hypothetical protein